MATLPIPVFLVTLVQVLVDSQDTVVQQDTQATQASLASVGTQVTQVFQALVVIVPILEGADSLAIPDIQDIVVTLDIVVTQDSLVIQLIPDSVDSLAQV